MIAFLRTFFAVILAIVFLSTMPLFLGLLIVAFGDTGPRDGSWLTIRLTGALLEHYPPPSLRSVFDDPPPCLMEITENLEKAAVDDRIEGVILRIDGFAAGVGKLDEIRAGIRKVRAANKEVFAYGSYLEEAGVYLGSECDATYLFPEGRVYFLGRGFSIQHVKGLLEKLDVNDQLHRIEDYKSAAELFTQKTSSEETLENLRWLVEDVQGDFDDTLTENLGLDPGALARLRERAILRGEDAVEEGVVTELLYWDELEERLRGPEEELLTYSSGAYKDIERRSVGLGGKQRVAVIHAQGFVSSGGEDRYDPVVGLVMGTDRVIADLRAARNDDDIKAIILRWDTGGGATDGAQRLAREVSRARDEKPVIVSIADVAASGGYMMSHPANWIVCAENGITGSIGSVTGKFNMRGLWEKLGITFDDVAFDPNAFLYSDLHDFTESQWERVAEDNWAMYNDWVEDIAQTRQLTFDEVDASARGRVWTGRQAKERKLVDELGGFDEAVSSMRRLADLDEDEKVTFVHYPEERTVLDLLLSGDLERLTVGGLLWEVRRAVSERFSAGPVSLHFQPFRME